MIARGYSSAEIGDELFISETTVKTHITHILQKLQLRDRVQVPLPFSTTKAPPMCNCSSE
jgi:DNA-binding NarL/FixJ family response regulator